MVKIELLGLEFFAYHGVYSNEKKEGNNFVVNLTVIGDFGRATKTDELSDTVNYESLYELVSTEMARTSNLLEHVAGRILDKIVNEHSSITDVEVSVEKLNPPIKGSCKTTRVSISKKSN